MIIHFDIPLFMLLEAHRFGQTIAHVVWSKMGYRRTGRIAKWLNRSIIKPKSRINFTCEHQE